MIEHDFSPLRDAPLGLSVLQLLAYDWQKTECSCWRAIENEKPGNRFSQLDSLL